MKKLLKSMVLTTALVMMIAGVQMVAFADDESSDYESAVPISDELSQAEDADTTDGGDDGDDDNNDVTNPDTGVAGIAPAAVALIAAGAAAVALKAKK